MKKRDSFVRSVFVTGLAAALLTSTNAEAANKGHQINIAKQNVKQRANYDKPALNKIQNSQVKIESDYSYLDIYDTTIKETIDYFKEKHGRAPESNLIKAMIAVESGNPKHRTKAFLYDPMQIANQGDHALHVLAEKKENTYLIGDFSSLEEKKETPHRNGVWDYSQSNMDAKSSILGGVGWLYHKSAIHDIKSQDKKKIPYIKDWRSWEEAVKRYNGGGNKHYLKEVLKIKSDLDLRYQQKNYFNN
ncbi:MAG: hypothetical protein Q7S74_03540 [Nanoarchaeota archaeon]|nr:hypothetical protein [Nanoarchaeota archaeon]